MGGILKLHDYKDVVDRAMQEAKAEEQYFNGVSGVNVSG
jgi:hypothetical protein